LSLHHSDPPVRAEAGRTGMAAVEAEPELRTAVIRELKQRGQRLPERPPARLG